MQRLVTARTRLALPSTSGSFMPFSEPDQHISAKRIDFFRNPVPYLFRVSVAYSPNLVPPLYYCRGGTMTHISTTIKRPICKRCGVGRILARTSPDGRGLELPRYECPKCEDVVVEPVAIDPLELAKGWLSSELKPPQ